MGERSGLRIIPLGGLGEFGMNCMVLEREDSAIAIDCGVMFPEEGLLGVDRVIPDLEYLQTLGERFHGFVLTHGHEDHLGALPHVLGDLKVPVWAGTFTSALLERKLEQHPAARGTVIHHYEPRKPFRAGAFEIEGIHVTHSIVEACSLAIRSGDDTIIHTGDFKLDPTPVDGRRTDIERFRQLGDQGVRLLLSDSTNVEREGKSGSEAFVRGYLEPCFERTSGRVFVTTFASHIHRLAAVVSLCQQFGRKLAIIGRSMEANAGLATREGHLRIPGSMLVSPREAANMRPDQICYLVTGSQGEPGSALMRIAMLEMRHLQPGPGDAVIYSSKVIPGNERAIGAVIDQLYRCGVEVYYQPLMPLHVSGHAYKEELRTMLELVRPEFFVPVHGNFRNLVHHSRLAQETGVPAERCFEILDGDVLELDAQGCRRAGTVPAGRVLVDGDIGGVDEDVIRDRRNIGREGMVVVVLSVSRQTGEILSGPEIVARGLAVEDGDESIEEARQVVVDCIGGLSAAAIADRVEVAEQVRLAVRRHFRRTTGSRPVVVPYIAEL